MLKYKSQNIWFNEPVLRDDEEMLFQVPANHTQGKRAVGGKLFITKSRILFIPNRMDDWFGGKAKEINLEDVCAVGMISPRFSMTEIFSGGWTSRMFVEENGGEKNFFVVNQLKRTLEFFKQTGIPTTDRKLVG